MSTVAALVLMFSTAAALDLQPHGRVFSNVYVPLAGLGYDGTLVQQVTGAQLQLDPKLSETQSLSVTAQALHYTATAKPDMARSALELREGYYRYSKDGWDLRAGRQIISLSKSDVVGPTEFLIGTDVRRFGPSLENRRIGADGVMLSWIPDQGDSPWNVTGVWNLDFAKSTLLLGPAQQANAEILETAEPPMTFENSEVAVKTSYIQSSWDAALTYFDGWNHMPELTKAGIRGFQPIVRLEPRFSRIRAVGVDTSYSFERYVWKFEAAYTRTPNDSGRTAMYQPSHLDAVMGIEHPFWQKARWQIQGVARYFPKYRDPNSETGVGLIDTAVNQGIARANSLVQGYDRSWKAGVTGRLAYGDDDNKISPELFLISYPSTEELFLRPRVLYRWSESLQLDVGVERYIGPKETVIGRFEPYSAYFAEARWLF